MDRIDRGKALTVWARRRIEVMKNRAMLFEVVAFHVSVVCGVGGDEKERRRTGGRRAPAAKSLVSSLFSLFS